MKLKDLYQVKSRFHRSVQIELDAGLGDYVVTQAGLKILWRIANAFEHKFATKAWSVTGPYGSGKSAFVIFLRTLFGESKAPETKRARELLRRADRPLHKKLFDSKNIFEKASKGFCPAFVSASRERIEHAIIRGLLNGLRSFHGNASRHKIIKELEDLLNRCEKGKVPTSDVLIKWCESAIESIVNAKGIGLILVIDELGKCLEAAALNAENDIFILQQLAEFASRGKENNFLFFTVLHQSFDRYALRLGSEKRSEWAKIQGRFEDISFVDSSDQAYKLIAYALDPLQNKQIKSDIVKATEGVFKALSKFVPDSNQSKYYREVLCKCLPLHPLTTMVLAPLFRSKFAQNERSLFAFLTSMEPCSFTDFINKTEVDDLSKNLTLYCPHNLYDYLMANFGITLFTHSHEKKWVEIDQALSRTTDELEKKVIKTIGLLNLIGENLGFPISFEAITCAIGNEKKTEIRQDIENLSRKSVIVFRRHSSSYVLWGGSDIDVEKRIQECIQSKINNSNIAEMLNKLFPMRPKVGKKHLYKTGTLRYFSMRYVDEPNLHHELEKDIVGSDGQILLVINSGSSGPSLSQREIVEIFKKTDEKIRKCTIIGYTANTDKVINIFKELLALQWIRKNTPELQGDQIAMREIDARLLQVERLAEEMVSQLFFSEGQESNGDTHWIKGVSDKPQKNLSKKDLSTWISEICDSLYKDAPDLKNELINRSRVSSTSSSARRLLLHHILEDSDKKDLGIQGSPPELSMYKSVLLASKLHQQLDAGKWGFVSDVNDLGGSSWKALWSGLAKKLEENEERKVPVVELTQMMKDPPFGLREGVIPVVLAAVLKAYNTEIALFEQGTFKPVLHPTDFDLLTRVPHKFSIQLCRLSGIKAQVFDQIIDTLVDKKQKQSDIKKISLLNIVKMLCTFAASLPSHARNTQNVSDKARAVRKCLLEAVEPANLLYRDLPIACGFSQITNKTSWAENEIKAFVSVLRDVLVELQRKEMELFANIENILLHTFSFNESRGGYRELVAERAERIMTATLDPALKSFLVRVVDTLEHKQWLDSIGSVVLGRSPSEWSDGELLNFEQEMAAFKAKIEKYERIVLDKGIKTFGAKDEVLHISIVSDKKPEKYKVVHLQSSEEENIRKIHKKLEGVFQGEDHRNNIDAIIGAMGKYIASLIDEHAKAKQK